MRFLCIQKSLLGTDELKKLHLFPIATHGFSPHNPHQNSINKFISKAIYRFTIANHSPWQLLNKFLTKIMYKTHKEY